MTPTGSSRVGQSVCPHCGMDIRPGDESDPELVAAVKVIVGVRDLVLAPSALDAVVRTLHHRLGWGDAKPSEGGAPTQEPEYRLRILVELALLPDQDRGTSKAQSHAHAAAIDACTVKSFFEDEDLQRRIDEGGYRGRIIGASVEDVREVGFAAPIDIDELIKDWRGV